MLTMETDDKENIGEYNSCSRVPSKMDSSDQNKSLPVDIVGCPQNADLQPVDQTTDKRTNTPVVDQSKGEDRWINDKLLDYQDDDEAEVFFGDVTNREIKKTKKYNARKTAVFVPGFRMDRHLMRYTMCPPVSKQPAELEEPPGKENKIAAVAEETDENHTCSTTEEAVGIAVLQSSSDEEHPELSVASLIGELKDIENELNGMETKLEKTTSEVALTASKPSEGRVESGHEVDLHITESSGCDCQAVSCVENSSAAGVAKYGHFISEVVNDEGDTTGPDCSLLLSEGTVAKPCSMPPSSSVSSEESSEDEESVNREIVNNMLRALDRRMAILSALSKMRQHPDNNPNTKGKPESFERMLKESEDKNKRLMENGSDSGKELLKQNCENRLESNGEALDEQFKKLGIQSEEVATKCCTNNSQHGKDMRKRCSHALQLYANEDSNQQACKKGECENPLCTKETDSLSKAGDGLGMAVDSGCIQSSESLHSGDAMSSCALVFSNRNNNNANEAEAALDQDSGNINQLSLDALPDLTEKADIIQDSSDLAIETIVAEVASIEDLAMTLPELDVNDVIDLLKEGPGSELFTPQRDAGLTGIMADGNLQHRRIVGDNTVVVASNNYQGSPLGAMAYHNLPEFPARIGATHTVTSVQRPISSPGAVRCHRGYRSIYATLPDDSIEIETQVVPECHGTELLASFGSLELADTSVQGCPLDNSLLTSTHVVLPVGSCPGHQDGASTCSPNLPSPHFEPPQLVPGQNSSSPLLTDGCVAERPAELAIASRVQRIQPNPTAHGFSPGVVFTEKNFSPILEVNFPDSSPIQVPTGLKCDSHSLFPAKFNLINLSNIVSREKKRKQPDLEYGLAATKAMLSLNLQSNLTKVKTTPNKGRTPPKKVIGSPTIHRFHTAFGKNPASRSLLHQFGIHVSPRPVGRASSKTPGSRGRTKPLVTARERILSSKPPAVGGTPSNKAASSNAKAKTPNSLKKKNPSCLKMKTATSADRVLLNTCARDGPIKSHSAGQSGAKTLTKLRQSPSSVSSAQRGRAKKSADVPGYDPVVTRLFSRTTPSKRFQGTPGRTGHPMPPAGNWAFGRQTVSSSKMRGTPQRKIRGEKADNVQGLTLRPKRAVTPQQVAAAQWTHTLRAGDARRDDNLPPSRLTFTEGNPRVFAKGTPCYLPKDGLSGAHARPDTGTEPPPAFDLYDFPDSPQNGDTGSSQESSPRLSMADVLERKRQQMITLRAEKRKINDIKTRQGSPTVKSPRANNRVSHDSPLKQRLANTQTLTLTDKELEAVTQVHTLCNSQRTVKVIHKGRAMLIRQVPQSPHLPERLSWNENLLVEISEDSPQSMPSSPEGATSPPRPILNKKDAHFVYPYDDGSPLSVVVFRSRNGDRHQSTRSPRID